MFIPLGFGANFVGTIFITHQALLFKIAALIFLAYAIWTLVGHGRSRALPGVVRENPRSIASVFLIGILTAFATGTCAAPNWDRALVFRPKSFGVFMGLENV